MHLIEGSLSPLASLRRRDQKRWEWDKFLQPHNAHKLLLVTEILGVDCSRREAAEFIMREELATCDDYSVTYTGYKPVQSRLPYICTYSPLMLTWTFFFFFFSFCFIFASSKACFTARQNWQSFDAGLCRVKRNKTATRHVGHMLSTLTPPPPPLLPLGMDIFSNMRRLTNVMRTLSCRRLSASKHEMDYYYISPH